MSSYSGPTKADPTMASPVYGFDTGKAVRSGVDAVTAGLAAAANQTPVVSNVGESIAELGTSIGSAIGNMDESKRSQSISQSKKEGKTGKEARAQWKREKSEDFVALEKSKAKEKEKEKKFGARFGNASIIDENLI